MERRICVARLSGLLTSGAEKGKGHRWHIVPNGGAWDRALCGAEPGKHSGSGFIFEDQKPTCPRCLKRDEKRKAALEARPRPVVRCSHIDGHYFKVQEDGANEGRSLCIYCGKFED